MNYKSLGIKGENIAIEFLKNNGIEIIYKNYFSKYGEIDLIGIQKRTIIFIEVKLRKNFNYGLPEEAITGSKIKKLLMTAEDFLQNNQYEEYDCRWDVITLLYLENKDLYQIKWIKQVIFD